MKYLEQLTANRDDLVAQARTMIEAAEQRGSLLTDIEQRDYDKLNTDIEAMNERIAELRAIEAKRETAKDVPHYRKTTDPWKEEGDIQSRSLAALEQSALDELTAERANAVIRGDAEFAARFLVCSDPNYLRAFVKMMYANQLAGPNWNDDERAAWQRAMVVSTNTQGGFMSPTHLDPTILLTNDGALNVMRQVATVVTLKSGDTWNGITSAGITASWDDELEEVSDDSPSIASAAIPVHKAQAYAAYSVEAEQDIDGLATQLRRLFADAKNRLEAAAYMTGTGTGEPTGLFTALDANTNVELVTTTAGTVGAVDIHAVYRALPQRFRSAASWVMNPLWAGGIRQLGTAVSANYSGDLRDPLPEKIIGRPVVESDEAPEVQTTTALDNILVFGDLRDFVIVDKPGFNIELIPHVFGNTNNRPIGARALWAWWRTGSDMTVDNAARLLQDKTSA